ncbi:MAG: type I restriction enzyme HsdR N-terminal domain-containing protein [Gammaproteobacteria bacterium]|nr:type I restriction enzyme HsdR N-terminal domain-containing protein [Gammaproteobacteria bacterium]
MEKESLSKFEQELKAYAEKMEGIFAHCDSEEQTKVSMINPFVELLDYDVRDPRVCKFEFVVNPKGAGTRVDYALFCDQNGKNSSDTPTILIEAKAASNDLTHGRLLGQISDYADLISSVEFVALTNGRIWKWFRKEKNSFGDRKLFHAPFITHDVLRPLPANSRELKFLKKISFQSFDSNSARQAADEVRFSDLILNFLEEIKETPGDDLRRLMFKRWGVKSTKRETELFVHVWTDCVETFIETQARKMQIDEILEQTKDSTDQNSSAGYGTHVSDSKSIAQTDSNIDEHELSPKSETKSSRSFVTDSGVVKLEAGGIRRAWKPLDQEHWNVESNSKDLYVNVTHYFASLYPEGKRNFYERCGNLITPSEETKNEPNFRYNFRQVDDEIYVNVNIDNPSKRIAIEEMEAVFGSRLVELWLPDKRGRH